MSTLLILRALAIGVLASAPALLAADKPILLIHSTASPFSRYNSEILQTEGLNSFDTAEIGTVTATNLAGYDVVLLGEMGLTAAQASLFSTWVNGGGYLVAMRPDKQLAPLLGLTDAGATLSSGYLLTNTAAAPGKGIVNQTIQFHGTADLYLLNGASSVATFYSSKSVATAYPAVTIRTGIGSGGKAAAFTYDLARSVVYTRQGNPAWAGQARIGQGGPIRPGDLFYGNAVGDPQPDWIDLSNIAIPQADEQQRLLANLVLHLSESKMPLPRFWYFPYGRKAVVIMTGDDHAQGGTGPRFDDYIAKSPAGCSVDNWDCIRGTSYVYPESPLTNTQAAAFHSQGFEVALHVNTSCANFTPASMEQFFSAQLSGFATKYPSVPAPTTNRTHCVVYNDWSTTPSVELYHGIRLDTTYYHFPGSWLGNRTGFLTGSGLPMRFAETDGSVIDVFQAHTQMTDESSQAYPATIDTLLDNALGSTGYFGAFTANMHTDYNNGVSKQWSDQIVSSALSRGVPVVSSKQMLQWVDARNGSSFASPAWSGSTLTFSVTAAALANGLVAMLPNSSTAGLLSSLTRGGTPVAFSVYTIKGIDYALFLAASGTYQATYGGSTPPVISGVNATSGVSTATVTWTTDKNSTSRIDYGTSASALTLSTSSTAMVTSHSLNLTGLAGGTKYYFRVSSVDATNGSSISPAIATGAASFISIDPTPPAITNVIAASGLGGTARISWSTNRPANSRVDYGTSAGSLTLSAIGAALVTGHSVTLTGLTSDTTYYFRVTSADGNGFTGTFPAAPNPPLSFVKTNFMSLWTSSALPANVDSGDTSAVELGLKFRSDVAGYVTGIRFYKSAANTGTHIGNLWSRNGTLLGSVTFSGETASGWQEASFPTAIPISANTTYVASYFAPVGRYSFNSNFFATSGIDAPPLRGLANGVDGSNGLYRYGTSSGFPVESFSNTNYWVDLVFSDIDTVPPTLSAVTATVAATSATITWTSDEPSNSRVDYGTSLSSLTSNVSNAPMVTSHSVALTGLVTGTTYYYRVTSVDAAGNSAVSPVATDPPASFVPFDNSPPVISAVTAAPGGTTATITWTTDKSSNSRVDYGTSAASLTLNVSNAALATSHSITLTGLTGSTTYYFRVTSTGSTGSTTAPPAASAPATFTTVDTTPPLITNVVPSSGLGGTATFTWTTDRASHSRIDYGTSAGSLNLNATNATLVTAHTLTLNGLTAGATYYYRVSSTDGNSSTATFPTPPNPPSSFVYTGTLSVWRPSAVPGTVDANDAAAVELGMKFRSDLAGYVTGVRFYKAIANTGTHIGNLWSRTGTLLGSVTFSGETASGWQQANFASPVPIAANTTYVISYFVPAGHYSLNENFFTSAGVNTPPLRALASGVDGQNGVYRYGSSSGFPSSSYSSSNYWVDVVFTDVDSGPPILSAVSAAVTPTSATITWTSDEASNSRVDYGTSPTALDTNVANASMVTSHSVALTGLTTGVTYYYRVTSADATGNTATSPVTTGPPATFVPSDTAPPVISSITATPGGTTATITWNTDKTSNSRVDYGISAGSLTLNTSDAALVTAHSVTLTGLTANTTYYFRVTSTGSTGSATAPAAPATPASFTTVDTTPPLITNVVPSSGLGGTATITWTTNKLSNTRVDYGTSAGTLNLNATSATMVTAHSINLTGLAGGAIYYFRVSSTDAAGNTTASPAPPTAPSSFVYTGTLSVWRPSIVPGTVDSNDASAVEVGLKFRTDVAGYVTGVRFYKATANTGTHVGNLWSRTGTLLGSVTFSGETASGWQQTSFASPIAVAANTTYVISYFAPSGRYSLNQSFFASAGVDTPPLHALASGVDGQNGVYRYGSTSGFPSLSYSSSNYWVDVVFTDTDSTAPSLSAVTATVGTNSATITWTSDEASDSRVDYGTSPSALASNVTNASMVTSHSIALSGLTPGVTYYYRVTSADPAGNSATSPVATLPPATFVVPAGNAPPVISAITASPANTTATITWTTDITSNSRVDYGTSSSSLNLNTFNASLVTAHSIALSGLTAGTTYYYRVTSVAGGGGSAQSPTGAPASFITTAGGTPPSDWDVSGAGDLSIQGFPTDISVNRGATISFKISTTASAYTIDIYRLGYYDGNGAAKIASITPSATLPQTQPTCATESTTGLVDCGNWAVSATWAVPATAKSGIYLAKLRRTDTGGASHIVFVVRDDASTSAIVFQTSDTTWQAYNRYGGNSLYVGSPAGRAYKVSYNRPITTRSTEAVDFLFNAEYPMIRWLEANGYDVTYTTGVDADRRGTLIKNHRLYLSVGHDEYWSAAQRTNVQAARDAGTHLGFFTGNEMFWKIRWENNYRTLVCYKETIANKKIDPTSTWTGTWRDPRFSPPSDGGRPENSLTGTLFTVNAGPTTLAVRVPAEDGKMRFWRNTGLHNQAPGAAVNLTSGTLGYEWDEDVINGVQPNGLIYLSTTQSSVTQKLLDYGSTYGPGTATHHTTLYRAASGALVFGAGTVQWSWGLDAVHDRGSAPADVRMQQAVVNLLADMGIQPTTLQTGLVAATKSTDTTPPTSSISSPAANANLDRGTTVIIAGTATDSGGGVVGGVDISVDGGVTWRRAVGRGSWTYSWTPADEGNVTIQVRATDDSLNTQAAATSRAVKVK